MAKLSIKEKQLFAHEFETVLSSGMSLLEGVYLLEENLDGNIKQAAIFLKDEMNKGISFDMAIADSALFDTYFEKMTYIGQLNGCMDKVMKELSVYYEREGELKNRISEAVSYPAVLMTMMEVIVGILLFKILPIFENVLNKIGAGSSNASKAMAAGKAFSAICFFCLLIIIVFIVGVALYSKYKDETIISRLLMKTPLTAKMYQSILTSRITYALSLFVHSGYPLEEAVNHLPELINETGLKKKIENVIEDIKKGNTFLEAISSSKIYEGLASSILNIGLKAGRQEETFDSLCDIYSKQSEENISSFLNIIEPSIIVLLSLMVGVILLSIMLPLISIMSSIG